MTISVEMRMRPSVDGKWAFTDGYSSIDAAKAACCKYRKDGGNYRSMDFRIYANDKLFLVNAVNSGWRLRWIPGNGKSRAEQSSGDSTEPHQEQREIETNPLRKTDGEAT